MNPKIEREKEKTKGPNRDLQNTIKLEAKGQNDKINKYHFLA